jgi:hypothetical protein
LIINKFLIMPTLPWFARGDLGKVDYKAWRCVALVLRTLKKTPVMVCCRAAGLRARQPADGEME